MLQRITSVVFISPLICVFLFQGDRGFDGLPGLPGDKGHRVSKGKLVSNGKSAFQTTADFYLKQRLRVLKIYFLE